jgi:(2Fe-2S) ferredoxin
MKIQKAENLSKVKKEGMALLSPATMRITIGAATCGLAKGARKLFEALQDEAKKQKIEADFVYVGCNGLCYAEPIVEVIRPGKPRITYGNVSIDKVGNLIQSIRTGKLIKEMALMRLFPIQKGNSQKHLPT